MIEADHLVVVASKAEVLSGDTTGTLGALRTLLRSPQAAEAWRERVDFAIDGYNDTKWELFEILEVREFVEKLDSEFPFWLFFLSKHDLGLQCITLCFLPPFLTPKAQQRVFPEQLDDLLSRRWFPAMNRVCEWVGMPEREIEAMSNRALTYLLNGPIR